MPIKPEIKVLTSTSVDVLNAIRSSATQNYQSFVPVATANAESVKEIGAIIMQYPTLQNEFLNSLVNRIGRVIITSKMYTNPWAMFKQGMLEFGEAVEEIFVNLAKPFQFDPAVAETNIFKREIPDIKAAFHIMNYQKYYKATVSNDQLRQAFLTWQGITDLIAKIVDSMYTGANYDEFQTMKYMLAKHILAGHLYPTVIPAIDTDIKGVVAKIKSASNSLEFMSNKYNLTKVQNYALKPDQYVIVNTNFDANMDVEVLASAFNMDKVQFMGQRVLVDGFGELDNARLAVLFADDPTYVEITAEEKEALNSIPALIVDKNYFMIFDNYVNFTEQYNGEGLYWNYWYHVWKTFSVSPFANAIMFIEGAPSVDLITLSPATATVEVGQSVHFIADVDTTDFASKAVDWSIDSEISYIDNSGNLKISMDEVAETITVTATSVVDPTVTGTATVTINYPVEG